MQFVLYDITVRIADLPKNYNCYSGPQPEKNFGGGAEVTFGNDYDVIEVQSNMMRLFCYDQLTNSDGGTFFIMGAMGVHRREQNGRLPPPWKFGYEPSTSRKPEVNSLIPILIELILAMTVSFLVWHSHCTRAKFTVLVSCRNELLTVHSCPLICLQRQTAKPGTGLFCFWPLMRNNNMATNIQSSLQVAAIGVLPPETVEGRHLGK